MTPEQTQRLERVEQLLAILVKSDRYSIDKLLQLSDGRNVQTGRTTGTKIATATDQKVGFFGTTPVAQQNSISAPTSAGGSYSQSQAASVVTAVTNLINTLHNLGLTA